MIMMRLQKNKPINVAIILFFLSAFYSHASAQQVYYSYDDNGNRTREYIISPPAAQPQKHKKDTTKKDSVPVIAIYPNPTTGMVNVSISSLQNCGNATIYISDASGTTLTVQKTNSTISPVNMASYKQGTYYFKIILCDNEYSYKIVKLSPATGAPPKPPVVK
jgi:Secretion system C-terminal sorting domain